MCPSLHHDKGSSEGDHGTTKSLGVVEDLSTEVHLCCSSKHCNLNLFLFSSLGGFDDLASIVVVSLHDGLAAELEVNGVLVIHASALGNTSGLGIGVTSIWLFGVKSGYTLLFWVKGTAVSWL